MTKSNNFHFISLPKQNTHIVWICLHTQVTPVNFISPHITIQGVTGDIYVIYPGGF